MKKEYQEDSFMKGKKFLAMILSAALGMKKFAAIGRRVVEPEKKNT